MKGSGPSSNPATKAFILSRVNVDPITRCWNWIGTPKSAYPAVSIERVIKTANRWAWEIWNSEIVPEGAIMMHSCDNTRCVSPDHVSPATYSENVQDMLRKGRGRRKETYRPWSHSEASKKLISDAIKKHWNSRREAKPNRHVTA